MTMRNNREDQFYAGDENIGGDPNRHTERMRMFYDTNPGTFEEAGKSAAVPVSQRGVGKCRVALTVSESGGSAIPTGNDDWLSLAPMWRMALRRFSTN